MIIFMEFFLSFSTSLRIEIGLGLVLRDSVGVQIKGRFTLTRIVRANNSRECETALRIL